MDNKCIGCGASLQTHDKHKKGYIDPDVLYSEPEELICERCFNLKHYNKKMDIFIDESQFYKNVNRIQKDGGLVCNIVDIFDLEGTIIKNINDLFPNNKILLVCNKFDIFLKSVNVNRIKNYVSSYLKENHIKVSDVIIISSFKKEDIERLMHYILKLKSENNVYFFGTTNVGKSTLINNIINYFHPEVKNLITVSNTVNTTLDFIKIPLDKKNFLIDTPGIINQQQLTYYLDKSTLNKVMPKKFIKPLIFQLNPKQTLFINGFARIDFLSGTKANFVVYISNNLLCHRTKLDNADSFYKDHKDDILLYPNESERLRLGDFKQLEFVINEESKMDIVISGLGFVTIKGNAVVKVHCFEKINISFRKAII